MRYRDFAAAVMAIVMVAGLAYWATCVWADTEPWPEHSVLRMPVDIEIIVDPQPEPEVLTVVATGYSHGCLHCDNDPPATRHRRG